MNEEAIRLLEDFINAENQEEVLDRMHPLSSARQYFSARAELYSEDQTKFESLIESLSNSDKAKASMLKLRKLLSRLDSSPSEVINKVAGSYIRKPSFDYSAPEIARSENEMTYPSELDSSIFQINLRKAHRDPKAYRNLAERELANLEVSEMSDQIFKEFLSSCYLPCVSGVPERIVQLIRDKKFNETDIFDRLGLSQLIELEAVYPSIIGYNKFVHAKIHKQYLAGTEHYSEQELFGVFEILWNDIQSYPDQLNYVKLSVLNALLTLGIQFGCLKAQYFQEFITLRLVEYDRKNPQSQIHLIRKFPELSVEDLIKSYAPEVIEDIEDVKNYSRLIDTSWLLKEFAKNQILKGEPIDEYKNLLSPNEIENLGNSVELEFCKENQKVYARTEEVSIKMKLKNIHKILVRVLEINTKAYYGKRSSKIKTDINLDGLVAKEEQVYEYSESPFIRVTRSYNFPSLSGRSGLFAIEFIGNGRYSRALIQKGSLKYVSKVTIAGHMLAILDENNKVCKEESAGVTVDGRFYSSTEGYAIIPFAPSRSHKNIVLTDGHIAELVPGFEHLNEVYELKTAFLIHPEQFLMGNRTTINMKPVLFLNGIKAHESLLTDLSVTVNATDIDNISTSKMFKRLSLPKDTDLLSVEIEVPPRLNNIEIVLSGKVKYASTQKTSTLTSRYQKAINVNLKNSRIFTTQLRAQIDGFYIEVRGRNGEPLKNVLAELTFKHSSLQSDLKSRALSTDANGLIKLGHLPGVKSIAGVLNKVSQVAWSIDTFENQSSYPSIIYLCQGDEFGIPMDFPASCTFHPYSVTFLFYKSGTLIGPAYDKLNYENSILSMNNLEIGTYVLRVPDKALITIEVVDGHHWGTGHIVTENMAISTAQQYRSIAITDTFTESDELVVKVTGDIENTVLHAISTTYHSQEFSQMYSAFAEMFNAQYSELRFEKPISFYLNSVYLDEEYRYVLDRRQLPRFLGNTLPKPQVLLKRMMLSETETVTQQARAGENLARMSDLKRQEKAKLFFNRKGLSPGAMKLTDNLDFLEHPALNNFSVELDEKGIARLPISSNHSEILLIATNQESCCSKIAVIEGELKLRELRLAHSMDNSLSYAEQKKCEGLQAGSNFLIKDSTQIEIIDSLSKLYNAQVAVIKVNHSSVNYGQWSFLGEWGLLSLEKKLELFESFSSHELHLFIYKKDRVFFDEIVRPYLVCKMEKDFIDKFLLGENIEGYTKLHKFSSLNNLEKCLLIQRMKESDKEFAVKFTEKATKLLVEESVSSSPNEGLRSKQYDSILGSRSMEIDDESQVSASKLLNSLITLDCPEAIVRGNARRSARGGARGSARGSARGARDYYDAKSQPHKRKIQENDKFKCESESDNFFSVNDSMLMAARETQPVYYEKLGTTKEFVETYYYNQRPGDKVVLRRSKFWGELAASPYVLSDSFLDQTSTLTELVLVLAFSPLEFQPERYRHTTSGVSVTITASSPTLIFYRELSEAPSNLNTEILVTQRYIDLADNYVNDESGHSGKTVTQFLKNHEYMCQVIVTNTSAVHMKLNLLIEVPQGSIPLVPYKYSDTLLLEVPSFHTLQQSYRFYFPESGTFTHFPANVSFKGTVISKANPSMITVQERLEVTEFSSFVDLVIGNKKEMILDFLRSENLFSTEKRFDWNLILHMMKDLEFWRSVIDILKDMNYFHPQVWEFSIYHKDPLTFAEYLLSIPNFSEKIGYFFTSKYIETGKLSYQHREFDPLVNARAYRLADKDRITNKRFLQTYQDFLLYLAEKPVLENEDYISWTQYMILQDRLEEANEYYSKIQMDHSCDTFASEQLQLQYDYLSCYLNLEKAKIIAPLYKEYPIETWRNYFKEALDLIAELSEEGHLPLKVIEQEPSLDFEIESGVISLHYSYVDNCKVRLYLIDLEVLFSKQPFFIKGTQDFSFVTANIEINIDLDTSGKQEVRIPDDLINKNLVIEVDYNTYVASKPHFANSLKTIVTERYGIIKVMDLQLIPRPRTYVKAFAKYKNGNIEFYKDGYTDIRGKFDFVSLNVDLISQIEEFALLVVDDELGSQVSTAKPPPQ